MAVAAAVFLVVARRSPHAIEIDDASQSGLPLLSFRTIKPPAAAFCLRGGRKRKHTRRPAPNSICGKPIWASIKSSHAFAGQIKLGSSRKSFQGSRRELCAVGVCISSFRAALIIDSLYVRREPTLVALAVKAALFAAGGRTDGRA